MNEGTTLEERSLPDELALRRLLAVRPTLRAIALASDVIEFEERMLLHAGPPVCDLRDISPPLKNSLISAILYERWENSYDAADRLLLSGAIRLSPAQDHFVAVPLADILSPSMKVLVVEDGSGHGKRAFSPLNSGDGPAMRVGQYSLDVLHHLRWLNDSVARNLAECLHEQSFDLISIADRALLMGDDCHGLTKAGSLFFLEQVLSLKSSGRLVGDVREFLLRSPSFFLNIWMAAVKCIFAAMEGVEDSGLVTSIGGNGRQFGLQIASRPRSWFVCEATPPMIPGRPQMLQCSAGAIGDSAIVDAFGCGAMVTEICAPETRARFFSACEEYKRSLPRGVLDTVHPGFRRIGSLKTGLSVRRVAAVGMTPAISLGVLDASGQRGRLDGGFFFTPISVFEEAASALRSGDDSA